MAKTEFGEFYEDDIEGAEQIAFTDNTDEPYTVDQSAIWAKDGKFIFGTASGCSCWGGDWYGVQYDTLEELFNDIGPEGEADYEFHPNFTAQENLRAQAEEWQSR